MPRSPQHSIDTTRARAALGAAFWSVVSLALPTLAHQAHAQPEPLPSQGAPREAVPDSGEPDEDHAVLERTHNRVNLRVGTASSDDNQRPTVCLEVRAVSRLSIEGCGTGGGFLHHAPGSALTHFRAKWQIDRRVVWRGVLRAQFGLGMTELQIAADNPGFVVRPEPDGVEAIGPEGSIGLQWLRPMNEDWEFIVNTTAGLSWIPGAPSLRAPQDSLQPFVAFEIGVGW